MMIEAGSPFKLAAQRFAERVALCADGRSQTFAELSATANRIGSALAGLGLKPGDRVGVLAFNSLEVVALWLGLERFGFVRVVLHSHFDMAVHVRTMNEVEAKALVFDARFLAPIAARRKEFRFTSTHICVGAGTPEWATGYAGLLQAGSNDDPRLELDEDAPCFLQLTSGTTGQPKPWAHSHRSWRAVIANNLEHLDTLNDAGTVTPEDVNLHFHALQWATGFQTLMPYLLRGARTVILDDERFEPVAIADAIVREGVTGTLAPAPMLPPILDELERRHGGKSMRRLIIFFATPELLDRATQVLGPVWCHGFGSTEQGAPTTRLTAADVNRSRRRITSVGRPASPFFEMAVTDANGRKVPAGDVGEIVVRSAMSNGYYWNLPEKTAASFFPGGWFRPNDIGFIDDDGFLHYLDRAKDRIATEAGFVYPHAVESAVLRHAKVANCGVVGLGAEGRQSVVAAVLLKSGVQGCDELAGEILRAANQGLEDHERVAQIVFVTDLPTVLGGAKVQREVLQTRLAAELVSA
jgi:acyl-coenzyme A synthetase/AMP-(fatty) acid ligase